MRLILTDDWGDPGFVNQTGPVEMLRNMPKIPKISLLAVSVALVLSIFLGVNAYGVRAADDGQQGAYRQINVYGEVLQHIQSDYVEVPDIPAVTNGALRGLLESLDADSSYLSPEEYKTYKDGQGRQGAGGDQRLEEVAWEDGLSLLSCRWAREARRTRQGWWMAIFWRRSKARTRATSLWP